MSLLNTGVFLPIGPWVEKGVEVITDVGEPVFDAIKNGLTTANDALAWVLQTPPFWAVMIVLVAIAWFSRGLRRGWLFGVGAALGLFIIYGVNQWDNAMDTLALVLLASAIALIIAIPLGIWAGRNNTVSAIVRPILDFMQTMPAFVYLIPTVVIFLTGVVPGIVATIIFAMAPGVRFTELGIRQVDSEVVEAGQSFGASPGSILSRIQLPLALPTIMAGVNQVIMLSLSMVVIAGLVGAGGLGRPVVTALSRVNVALGFEAGLSVVILAIFLDRVTSGIAQKAPVAKAQKIAASR